MSATTVSSVVRLVASGEYPAHRFETQTMSIGGDEQHRNHLPSLDRLAHSHEHQMVAAGLEFKGASCRNNKATRLFLHGHDAVLHHHIMELHNASKARRACSNDANRFIGWIRDDPESAGHPGILRPYPLIIDLQP